MGGDPVPGPFDILRDWFNLDKLSGKERKEAIARIKKSLNKRRKYRRSKAPKRLTDKVRQIFARARAV